MVVMTANIRLHANFIHASPHLCCQVLGPSLIKPRPSLLNLVSRIKVRLLATSSKRYPSQNRKCRTTESIYALITFDNQNQMVTFVMCMIIKCSEPDDHFCMIRTRLSLFLWSGPDDHLGDGQLNRCRRKTVDLHYSVEAYDRQTAFWCLSNIESILLMLCCETGCFCAPMNSDQNFARRKS